MARTVGKDGLGFSGSIGKITFRQTKHGTVVCAKSEEPKNRRTPAQQRGRLIMRHLTSFFTKLKPHLPLAFETKASNLTDTNAFVSANYHGKHPVFLSLTWRERGAVVLAPYIITDGTLPEVETELCQGAYRTDIRVGDAPLSSYGSMGRLARELIARNSGLHNGDEIIYIAGCQTIDCEGVPRVSFSHQRLVLDTMDPSPVDAAALGEGFCNHGGFLGQEAGREPMADGFAWVHLSHGGRRTRVSSQRLVLKSTTLCDMMGTDEALMDAIKDKEPDLSALQMDSEVLGRSCDKECCAVGLTAERWGEVSCSSWTTMLRGGFEASVSAMGDPMLMESTACDADSEERIADGRQAVTDECAVRHVGDVCADGFPQRPDSMVVCNHDVVGRSAYEPLPRGYEALCGTPPLVRSGTERYASQANDGVDAVCGYRHTDIVGATNTYFGI